MRFDNFKYNTGPIFVESDDLDCCEIKKSTLYFWIFSYKWAKSWVEEHVTKLGYNCSHQIIKVFYFFDVAKFPNSTHVHPQVNQSMQQSVLPPLQQNLLLIPTETLPYQTW